MTGKDKEVWKKVDEAPRYRVSNRGRVRGARGRLLRPTSHRYYATVLLSVGPLRLSRYVHQLVAAAFIGPRPSGLVVNHKNRDRFDNAASNLEYVTQQENMRHAVASRRAEKEAA